MCVNIYIHIYIYTFPLFPLCYLFSPAVNILKRFGSFLRAKAFLYLSSGLSLPLRFLSQYKEHQSLAERDSGENNNAVLQTGIYSNI